jgi:hypothetical protein
MTDVVQIDAAVGDQIWSAAATNYLGWRAGY